MSNPVIDGLEKAQTFLASIAGAAEKAVAAALNRAVTMGRDQAIKAITDRYVVKASDVRDKLTTREATPANLSASVVAKSPSLSLGYFPHTPTEIGTGGRGKALLRAEILRGQERTIPGAFIAPIGGKPRVMQRVGGKTATGKARIKPLLTVPIASMLGAQSVQEAVMDRAYQVFEQQLDREIDRALGKAG